MNRFSRLPIYAAIIGSAALSFQTHTASALTVSVSPGMLRQAVTASTDPASETELTVTGAINAADFDFLREMTALRTLNLSGVAVASYSGEKTAVGLTEAKANTLPDCALMSGNFTSITLPSGLTEISAGALGGSNAESLVIPSAVTKIGDGAFSGMKNLKSVTIPASVTSMGEMLFKDCQALESVAVNASISLLPASTFQNCTSLSSVTLPSSLTAIGDGAFAGCTSLAGITLPSSLSSIGDMAFAASGLTSVNLSGDALKSIGAYAFAGCASLTGISVGDKLTTTGEGAFFNDPSLAVKLGDLAANITAIPDYLLYGAASASAEGFETTPVESVGKHALSGMKASKVTLPSTLSSLDDNAMERWENLTEIDAKGLGEVPALGESVWEDTPQSTTILYVPLSLLQTYKDTPQWQEFDVRAETSSKTDITLDDTPGNLRGWFDGMLLMLEADQDILSVQLYDISGRCVSIIRDPGNTRLTVDTSSFDTRVFIVRLLLADGATPVLKLLR